MNLPGSIKPVLCCLALGLIILVSGSCKQGKLRVREDDQQGSANTAKPAKLKTVTVLPYWVATAQFAGYYVGIDKGIFRKYGIDLKIHHYQPFKPYAELIKEGKVDFAILWLANAMGLKDQGADIVNIAQFSSRSSLMLLAKKSSGIKTIQDMNGKKAGIWSGFELQPMTLFKKFNLDVKIIPIGNTNNLFLMNGVEITNANLFDEYHSIINNGFNPDELNKFYFADYGLNFLEDGIYCLSDKIKQDPALCSDFINATLESWKYAFDHPEEAIEITIKYKKQQNIPANRSHSEWMLKCYRDLYIPRGKTEINTELSRKDYDIISKILFENKMISRIPAYNDFYKPYSSLKTGPDATGK